MSLELLELVDKSTKSCAHYDCFLSSPNFGFTSTRLRTKRHLGYIIKKMIVLPGYEYFIFKSILNLLEFYERKNDKIEKRICEIMDYIVQFNNKLNTTRVTKIYEVLLNFFKRKKTKRLLYSFRIFKLNFAKRLKLAPSNIDNTDESFLTTQTYNPNVMNHPHFQILLLRLQIEKIKNGEKNRKLHDTIKEHVHKEKDKRFERLFIEYCIKVGEFKEALAILENLRNLNIGLDQHFFKMKWVLIKLKLGKVDDWISMDKIIEDYIYEPDFMADILEAILDNKLLAEKKIDDFHQVKKDSGKQHNDNSDDIDKDMESSYTNKDDNVINVNLFSSGTKFVETEEPEVPTSSRLRINRIFVEDNNDNRSDNKNNEDLQNFVGKSTKSLRTRKQVTFFMGDDVSDRNDYDNDHFEDDDVVISIDNHKLTENRLADLLLKHLLVQEPEPNFWKQLYK